MREIQNLTLIDIIIPRVQNKSLVLIKDIVLILNFAFLTGLTAQLKIEIGLVPITMQTLMVLLAGALLGAKRGALSQITYLGMGLLGLPWFSRGGGMAYILSPTFGYIIGFVLAAYLVGYLAEKGLDRNIKTAVLAMLAGNIILYVSGLLWLARFVGYETVLAVGLYPFIIGDLLKIAAAGLILPISWKALKNIKN